MSIIKTAIVSASLLLLLACSDNATEIEVVQSPNDDRSYSYQQLDNGLQVLLISDPGVEMAAVSLNVNSGSKDDPLARPGLAHFVEHMLFLGTDKYPEAGEYQRFLSDHAGSHNAYTSFENTNYFFEIKAGHLEPAMDRFSRFFVKPLLQEEYVEREKNAVHSEYKAFIQHDGRRYLDVLKTVVNPDHPFAKFTVGNLDTLAEQDGESLREAAVKFYQEHYSANQMALVVLGDESIDQLQQWVEAKFSPVPNHQREVAAIDIPLFEADVLPIQLDVQPIKNTRSVTIAFPVTNPRQDVTSGSLHLIGDILGHEGEGSLFQYLKSQGWAEALSAGLVVEYNGGGLFGVTVQLTEAGLTQVDAITNAVFYTIKLLRDSGIDKNRFDEQRLINNLDFAYLEKMSAMHYVTGLSPRMKLYKPENLLNGPYLLEDYKPELINQYLAELQPANAIVSVSAQTVSTEQQSPYYQTPYALNKISSEQLAQWQQPAVIKEITIPAANPFIPTDFTSQSEGAVAPEQVTNDFAIELWHGQSAKSAPRGSIQLLLNNAAVNQSIENLVAAQLWVELVNDALNTVTYPASLVGFSANVSVSRRGVQISSDGYNDKQDVLLQYVLKQLVATDYSDERFATLKQSKILSWRNAEINAPFRVLSSKLNSAIYVDDWSAAEYAQAAERVELAEVIAFAEQFIPKANATLLVYGNFSEGNALAVAQQVSELLAMDSATADKSKIAIVQLAANSQQMLAYDLPHNDAATVLYMQAQQPGYHHRAQMGLAAKILHPVFYNSLRTEQQFGYVVYASARVLGKVGGIGFVVQSPSRSVVEIEAATRKFLQQQLPRIESMTEDEFAQHQAALVAAISKPPQNISQEAGDYWYQLVRGYTDFELDEKLIAAIEAMTLPQWQQFYRDYFIAGGERSILFHTKVDAEQKALLQQRYQLQSVAELKSQSDSYVND